MSHKGRDLRNLTLREEKCWRVFDGILGDNCNDKKLKVDVAKWIMSRLYPEKTAHEHSGDLTISLTSLIKKAATE